MTEKYKATIADQELRGRLDEPGKWFAVIALRPPFFMYDNQDTKDVLLGPNQEGVHVAPIGQDDKATYFRAASDRSQDGHKDIEAIRVRIEDFANHPVSAILNLPSQDYFEPREPGKS